MPRVSLCVCRVSLYVFHLTAHRYAVIVIFEKYLSSWLNDREEGRSPVDAVEEAAAVLAFVMHWRSYITSNEGKRKGLTLEANFLTRETFLDLITSCHGCILRFPQFRDNWEGKFKPDGPRFSSAYSEYFFQYGRMAQTNSPVVSQKGWYTHGRHYIYQQFLEATSNHPVPASCRGIPHTIDRIQIPSVAPDWHPSDDDLRAAIDRGVKLAVELLHYCGMDTTSATLTGFFKHPYKHFPLADVYDVRKDTGGDVGGDGDDEDPPEERPPHHEEVDSLTVDAADAADAEALLTQLMRAHPQVGEVQGRLGSDAAKAFATEVNALIVNFNQSIQEEAKDRKYRFVVKRLMKAHQRNGTLDDELDYYRDDDDVAVAFKGPDGEKWWILGNIEESTVSRSNVDESRAVANTGAEYLRKLDKDYKRDGVYIDDPKGLFVLRWYKEVDGSGRELQGYQNSNCKAYKLMRNNDGEAFRYTAQVQLISKVILKRHRDQAMTFTLNAKDAKMVGQKRSHMDI